MLKNCSKCKIEKELSEFHKDKTNYIGYYSCCKTCKKKYCDLNKERTKSYGRQYRIDNREKENKRINNWRNINKDFYRKYSREYRKLKYHNNINYKISQNIITRISHSIKNNYKAQATADLLGCSIEQLKKHLESQFKPGMTWDNYGKWHIDHIKPCASFDLSKPEEQKKCFHFSNLQPLWALDNIRKSNNLTINIG